MTNQRETRQLATDLVNHVANKLSTRIVKRQQSNIEANYQNMTDTSFSTTLARAQTDVEQCCELLAQHGLTIAFAESATAGFLSFMFSLANQSGKVLKGGIMCYDACVKEDVLHVPAALIEQFTPESLEVSAAIADGLARIISADIHVGVTGLTKPGGSESAEKPVGTMFTAIKAKNWQVSDRNMFSGTEQQIIAAAASNLCHIIQCKLTKHSPL